MTARRRRRSLAKPSGGGGGGSGTYVSVVTGDTPVSYWRMNESAGTTATDSIASHNGTYTKDSTGTNLPTLGATGLLSGVSDTAVSFDGTGGFVSLPNPSLSGSFSIEGWFTFTGAGSGGGSNGFWTLWASDNGNRLLWNVNAQTTLLAQMGGGNYNGTTNITNGQTHYIVYTVNGTTEWLYVDGTAQGSGNSNSSATWNNTWALGHLGTSSNTNYWIHGVAGELAIYNYALTSTQVSTHYAAR